MTIRTDFSFPCSYECEILSELPGGNIINRYFFPGGLSARGADGITLRVAPAAGDPWIGTFAFGDYRTGCLSFVLGMPDPDILCVISRGAAYSVAAGDPRNWKELHLYPVTAVLPLATDGLIILADFTNMVAYGREGVRWQTRRLAWDGLQILGVKGDVVCGEYYDLAEEGLKTFEVEIGTGKSRGGVESES